MAHEREAAATARTARNMPHHAAAAALSSRFATVTLDDAAQGVQAVYPNLELPPRRKGGELHPVGVGTLVLEWSRTHRHAGIEAHGETGVIGCERRHAGKLARALALLDAAVARWIEAVAEHHEARLAALAPHRDPPARRG